MNIFTKLWSIAAVCSFLSLSTAMNASAPDFSFRNITVKDGLSSNTVRSMIQSSDGLLWYGTANCLDSYDGVSITHHLIKDEFQPTYSNYINSLMQDGRETIWVGTDYGLYLLPAGSADLQRVDALTSDGVGIESAVSYIVSDRDENVWVGTTSQGVFCYNTHNGKLTQYPISGKLCEVRNMHVDSKNVVYAVASQFSESVYVYNRATDSFVPFPITLEGTTDRIQIVFEDSSDNLWIGTWNSGLFHYDRSSRAARCVVGPDMISHAHTICEYSKSELLIGSDAGLVWYDIMTGESRLFVNDRFEPTSISDKFVYPVIKDKEGGLWVGTYYGGVNYVSPYSKRFERYSLSRLVGSEENYVVSCFCEDGMGRVWVGSDNGGVICYSPFDNRVLVDMTPGHDNRLRSYNIHALCADGDYLWIGTYAGGLYRFDTKNNSLKNYEVGSIYSAQKLASGQLWIGTTSGIMVYDPASDSFRNLFNFGNTTTDIEQGPDGNIWLATSGKGLFCYLPSAGLWKNFVHRSDDPTSINCDFVNSVYASTEGIIWIATNEGLCRYDSARNVFSKVDLGGEFDTQYVAGDGSRVWVTTSRGLLSYSDIDGTMRSYGESEGLLNDQFMSNSGLVTSGNKIYVGSTGGFNAFYPHNIMQNKYVPPVIIREFKAGGDVMPLGETIRLPHSKRDVTILYAALSYCSPEKNRYRYVLEGYDKQWTDAEDRVVAPFTNLSGGHYRFVVQACNNDGVWNEEGAILEFYVRPHPLASPIAVAFYILAFLAAGVLILRANSKRYEKKYNERFDRAIKTRDEQDMAAKIQFVTMIAHEVRTPLSLINAPLENIMSRGEGVSDRTAEDLRVIDKNSKRLMKLINQLLDFSRVTAAGGLHLDMSECDIVDLVKSVCENFMPSFEKHSISFNCYCPLDSLTAVVDPEEFTKVVSNLLSNAVKYTKDSVSVSISRDTSGGTFSVIVSDNGRGLSASEKKKIFAPFYRVDEEKQGTGIGLVVVKQIVEAHDGSIIVNSTEGAGSEFMVTLPLHHEIPAADAEPAAPEAAEATPAAAPVADAAQQPERQIVNREPHILIVEDDSDMRKFLVSDFSREYKVVSAPDGDKAKELLKEYNISLIISDWMMPGTDGAALCRYVRETREICHIPFILLTAKADNDSVLESLDCGADAHVKKPFSPEHLHALVSHLSKMRSMLARKYSSVPGLIPEIEEQAQGTEKDLMTRVNEIIIANIANTELSVEMLCRELCMSRSALFTKVKNASGTTPNNIIMDSRLKAAAQLLVADKYSISEISYMVGFNSPSYFSKCFQRQYGLTPHDWQEKNK